MNSEIVNPIPDSAAPPAMRSRVSPGPNSPIFSSFRSDVDPKIPMNLPSTSPSTIPQVRGEVIAADRISGVMTTPALARANSGRIT